MNSIDQRDSAGAEDYIRARLPFMIVPGSGKRCRTCGDELNAWSRVPWCPVCRRIWGRGVFVGGVIAGVIAAAVKFFQ